MIPISKDLLKDVEKFVGKTDGVSVAKDGTVNIENSANIFNKLGKDKAPKIYKLKVVRNDITKEKVDAITNAANESL